jgi:phosphate transport system substrate-binding protein
MLRSKWLITALAGAAGAATLSVATATAASAATLSGAGSTLIAPLEQEWAAGYQASNGGTSITYAAVGSGAGLTDISRGLVDFGASDAPLSASSVACGDCVQMPWALSATGIGIHINGMRSVRLTGKVIGMIYLGKIKKWNDKRIRVLQKRGVRMPNLSITVYFRSDGSGDTYAFSDYERRVSPGFAGRIGTGTSLNWPTGVGARGNAGMVAGLQSTNGSIAYVATSYLIANWPRIAYIQNQAGNYVPPNYNNILNAAQSVSNLPGNREVHIVNPPKRFKQAFPISTYTYVVVHTSAAQAGLLKSFISYALGSGQAFGPRLGFVPIPGFVRNADLATLNSVH